MESIASSKKNIEKIIKEMGLKCDVQIKIGKWKDGEWAYVIEFDVNGSSCFIEFTQGQLELCKSIEKEKVETKIQTKIEEYR